MSEGQEFLKECKEVRNEFVAIAGQYTVDEHLKLRTEIDTLLIMYDQLCERVRLADSSDENSGLHKHDVIKSVCDYSNHVCFSSIKYRFCPHCGKPLSQTVL